MQASINSELGVNIIIILLLLLSVVVHGACCGDLCIVTIKLRITPIRLQSLSNISIQYLHSAELMLFLY